MMFFSMSTVRIVLARFGWHPDGTSACAPAAAAAWVLSPSFGLGCNTRDAAKDADAFFFFLAAADFLSASAAQIADTRLLFLVLGAYVGSTAAEHSSSLPASASLQPPFLLFFPEDFAEEASALPERFLDFAAGAVGRQQVLLAGDDEGVVGCAVRRRAADLLAAVGPALRVETPPRRQEVLLSLPPQFLASGAPAAAGHEPDVLLDVHDHQMRCVLFFLLINFAEQLRRWGEDI
jgi:hypothetical protein